MNGKRRQRYVLLAVLLFAMLGVSILGGCLIYTVLQKHVTVETEKTLMNTEKGDMEKKETDILDESETEKTTLEALVSEETITEEPMSEESLTEENTTEVFETEEESTRQTEAVKEISAEEILQGMTLEQKVAQLFIITPEALTGASPVTAAGEATRAAIQKYPVGGLVYFSQNILSEMQLVEMLQNTQQYSLESVQLPMFLCVDEEGGTVTRISGRGAIDVPYIGAMANIGQGTAEDAYQVGETIGNYLSALRFNVDFAPVADVATNPANSVIGTRSFGSDAEKDAEMVAGIVNGMHSENIMTTLKHFPGHGDTVEDSHVSSAVSYKTIDELRECEFLPFLSGIEAGSEFVMVGHISLPNVTGNDTPATLSYQITTEILREELGFSGIAVTDAMNMAAISNYYSSGEAAVTAIKAGIDMILMPYDFQSAYAGILSAVNNGTLSEERIDESLRRIIEAKMKLAA